MKLQTKIRLPSEWSTQDAVLLCWPHESMDWAPILDEVTPAFVKIATVICQQQQLILIARDKNHQTAIKQLLEQSQVKLNAITWIHHNNNDTWCRDFGPVCIIKENTVKALDFQFNGWGNKFTADADNALNRHLADLGVLPGLFKSIDFVLEGGSIDTDGRGTVLTTETCLLNKQRNSRLNKQQIEQVLEQELGCDRIFWLQHGYLEGDDTDAHIDNLARFCSEDIIVYASCNDETDPHFLPLRQMEQELKQLRTRDDRPYQLIDLEIPAPLFNDGNRLPASYVNFLIINHYVLMPIYNDDNDEINRKKLQAIFTDREVIDIACDSIVKQSGSVHCLTMQLPENSIKKIL